MIEHGRANPPYGVGGKAHVLVGIEPAKRLKEPDHSFLDKIGHRNAGAAIGFGNPHHKSEMAGDQPFFGRGIAGTGAAREFALFVTVKLFSARYSHILVYHPTRRTAMARKSDFAWTIISATLTLAQRQAWRTVTLAAIAAESGQKLDRISSEFPSKVEILNAFSRHIDAEILKEPIDMDGSVRDRLFELIMRRLDALTPHRPAIRAILQGSLGDQVAAVAGLCALYRSMSLTLEAAGVSATGPLGHVRSKALGALYLRIFYTWLRSDGADDRIMATLDKSLARAEQFAASFGPGAPARAPKGAG